MVYYASTIFQALGFQSGEKATLASLGIGIAKVWSFVSPRFTLSSKFKYGLPVSFLTKITLQSVLFNTDFYPFLLRQLVATIISLSFVDKGGKDYHCILWRWFCSVNWWNVFFSFPGRRRFLLIGVSIMAASILTLGIIAHYISLGHPTRKCHFNATTALQTSNPPFSSSAPHFLTTTVSPRSLVNSTLPSVNFTGSLNQTELTVTSANKGLRYLALSALVLFVGAYSFSFGTGNLLSRWKNQFYFRLASVIFYFRHSSVHFNILSRDLCHCNSVF